MYFAWMWLIAWALFGRSADAFDMMGFAVIIWNVSRGIGAWREWRRAQVLA
jgi:hypothetical protein